MPKPWLVKSVKEPDCDVTGNGFGSISCSERSFAPSGQDLTVDLNVSGGRS